MRIRTLVALGAIAAAAAVPDGAGANPDPVNGSVADGCQRNPAGLLSYTSPEWAFVGGKSSGETMRELQGTTTLAHTADEDLPESHASYDMDFDVIPDQRYTGLLAGDPKANGGLGNGNFAHDADQGKMHVEWESGSFPTFAWPTEGDRVHMWGQWVWDCGHWGQGIQTGFSNPQSSLSGTGDYFLPGQIGGPAPKGLRGEQTELHPIQALAVTRRISYRTPAAERQTDFFTSNDGTHAYAEAVCAKRLNPVGGLGTYGPDFSACVNTTSNNVTPLGGRTFEFLAPAPPQPSPSAQLTYRQEQMVSGQGFSEQLQPTSAGLVVRITDTRAPSDQRPVAFGASFFVGWSQPAGPPPTHLRWTLRSVTVLHSLSEPNASHPTAAGYPGVGVYNLYADLNGFWNFIGGKGLSGLQDDSWVPGLGLVRDGQTFTVNHSVDLFVPQDAPIRLQISGRECDLPRIAPCTANAELADSNDHPGTALVTYPSIAAALGEHTLASPEPSPSDPNYRMTYSITRVESGTPTVPAGGTGVGSSSAGGTLGGGGKVNGGTGSNLHSPCIRGHTPHSQVKRLRLRKGGFVVRGRSREASCTRLRAHGRIKSVWIAVALRRGRTCRFLGPFGFGRRRSCVPPFWLRARGRARWRRSISKSLPRGRYEVWVSAHDAFGNFERATSRIVRLR